MFTFWLSPSSDEEPQARKAVKAEPSDSDVAKPFNPLSTSDMSDTARTFPSRGRQSPLRYTSPTEARQIKEEDEDIALEATEIQPLAGEADDEDEGYAGSSTWRDSGIGTGIEEDRRGGPRRRKSSRGP